MSRYHQNVTWQSADGTWSRGFYEPSSYPEDPDDEWGVEFSDDFQWVSCGHRTEQQAGAAWDGVNPGYTDVYPYTSDTAAETLAFDVKAAELEEREQQRWQAQTRRGGYSWGYRNFNGPSRLSDPVILKALAEKAAAAVASLRCAAIGYRLEGYANDVTRALDEQRKRRTRYTALAEAAGATGINDGSQAYLEALRSLKERDDQRRAEASRYRGYGYRAAPQSTIDARRELDAELAEAEAAATARAAKLAKRKAKPPTVKPAQAADRKHAGSGRVPAGVPTGGQFTGRAHSESTVTLGGDDR